MYPQSTKKTNPNRETPICSLWDQAQKMQELVDAEDKQVDAKDEQAYMMMMMEE